MKSKKAIFIVPIVTLIMAVLCFPNLAKSVQFGERPQKPTTPSCSSTGGLYVSRVDMCVDIQVITDQDCLDTPACVGMDVLYNRYRYTDRAAEFPSIYALVPETPVETAETPEPQSTIEYDTQVAEGVYK